VENYIIDLDPVHQVFRITLPYIVTDQMAVDAYRSFRRLAAQGGPYASITDFSEVLKLNLSADIVRHLAHQAPPVSLSTRPRVAVVNSIILYSLMDMFCEIRISIGLQCHIVWSVDEAYAMLGVSSEGFSDRLYPETPVGVAPHAEHAL
jgi:hypothetical protein